MAGSNTDNYSKEMCDLKHKILDGEVSDVKESVEQITDPGRGHLALLREEFDKKLESLREEFEKKNESTNAKIYGLIFFYITTVTGLAISIGSEYIKRFILK